MHEAPREQKAPKAMKAEFCSKEEKIRGQYCLDMDVPQPNFKAEPSSKGSLSQLAKHNLTLLWFSLLNRVSMCGGGAGV